MAQSSSSFKKFFSFILVISIIALVAVAGLWMWLDQEMSDAHKHSAAQKTITVEPGATTATVLTRLYDQGIIASELPVRLWLRLFGKDQRIKAGDYQFKSPITPRQVIAQLTRGDVSTRSFTIPEGYNQFDIARVLAELPNLKQPPPTQPENLVNRPALIADLDATATTLEGYLFPDTYEYSVTTTREQLIEAMVKRFRKVLNAEMQQQAAQRRLTVRQVVTLASLIEKEAKVDSERELISQVFTKRMRLGERLACDPTVIYAALLEGRYRGKIYQSDLDRDSPYNTYKRAGLPPGPIASPGKRSLQAALTPANTDYLYFVVDASKNDGSHKFSASSADHERAVRLLRQAERNGSQ